jgi:hypothetical protein
MSLSTLVGNLAELATGGRVVEGTDIPSSAYRKLLEALDCMGCHPAQQPSWIWARLLVVGRPCCGDWAAGDWIGPSWRNLMKIAAWSLSRAMPLRSSRRLKYAEEPRWMVSDIIAYPDKIQNYWSRGVVDTGPVTLS